MLNETYKGFYSSYAYDYHTYKISTLQAILKNTTDFNDRYLGDDLVGFEETDFTRFLKSEIRMTCFHAIETLFELIFGLEPSNGKCNDYELLQVISTSDFRKNYARIGQMASNEAEFDFLDIQTPDFGNYPLWMHIFYFAPPNDPEVKKVLEESNIAIRMFLKEVATTFSNRNEYNAYKHGIRALNMFQEFGMSDLDDSNPVSFDLNDSMSFFTVEKDKGKVVAQIINTKLFNTNKDIKMTLLCSRLIANIILRRKWMFMPEDRKGPLRTYNFPMSEVSDMIRIRPASGGMVADSMTIRTEVNK